MLTSNMTIDEIVREVEWHTRGIQFPLVEVLLDVLQHKVPNEWYSQDELDEEIGKKEDDIEELEDEIEKLEDKVLDLEAEIRELKEKLDNC